VLSRAGADVAHAPASRAKIAPSVLFRSEDSTASTLWVGEEDHNYRWTPRLPKGFQAFRGVLSRLRRKRVGSPVIPADRGTQKACEELRGRLLREPAPRAATRRGVPSAPCTCAT
jgi:hypothetical protein